MDNFNYPYSLPLSGVGGGFYNMYTMPITPMYYGGYYGQTMLRPTLTSDRFEAVHRHKEKQKRDIKKILGAIGGFAIGVVTLAILKKNPKAAKKAAETAAQTVKP